ncbi:hypothetical protein R1sor_000025 [Riccia sorocarpa]|uniref:J domain-containing protein n=1 Tax=Riccia sorocarpa TaxID=122646 RepID=A0ABD3GS62_9MARC
MADGGSEVKECWYSILGIERNASAEEIRSAYRKEAMKWHPDKFQQSGASPEECQRATAHFQSISLAYEVLGDPIERAAYDKDRKEFLSSDTASQDFETSLWSLVFMVYDLWIREDWELADPRRTLVAPVLGSIRGSRPVTSSDKLIVLLGGRTTLAVRVPGFFLALRRVQHAPGISEYMAWGEVAQSATKLIWRRIEGVLEPLMLPLVVKVVGPGNRSSRACILFLRQDPRLSTVLTNLRHLFSRVAPLPAVPLPRLLRVAEPPRARADSVRIASINIRGLGGSREHLIYTARTEGWDLFGIQETLVNTFFTLPGYDIFQVPRSDGLGELGLAVCVTRSLRASLVHSHPGFLLVKVRLVRRWSTVWHVGFVYIPVRKGALEARKREEVLRHLWTVCARFSRGPAALPLLILGDFNMTPPLPLRLREELGHCLSLHYIVPTGDPRTFLDIKDPSPVLRRISALDHCLLSAPRFLDFGSVPIPLDLDLGVDHLPMVVTLTARRGAPPTPTVVSFDVRRLRFFDPSQLIFDEAWEVILSGARIPYLELMDTMRRLADSYDLFTTRGQANWAPISPTFWHLFKRRKLLVREFRQTPEAARRPDLPAEIWALKAVIRTAIKDHRRETFHRRVSTGNKLRAAGDSKAHFCWMKSWASHGRSAGNPSVQDLLGEVIYEDQTIVSRWEQYIRDLLAPTHPVPRQLHDRRQAALHFWDPIPDLDDDDFTLAHVVAAVRRLNTGKASGPDRFPAEWFKLILADPAMAPDANLTTTPAPFMTVLLRLMNSWFTSDVPIQANAAWICLLPKDPDLGLLDPDKTAGSPLWTFLSNSSRRS